MLTKYSRQAYVTMWFEPMMRSMKWNQIFLEELQRWYYFAKIDEGDYSNSIMFNGMIKFSSLSWEKWKDNLNIQLLNGEVHWT